jgi:hypothetical protein
MSALDGPGTRRRVSDALAGGIASFDSPFVGKYEYVDAAGRRSPAWTATHVRIRAYYVDMGRSLDELRNAVAALAGCAEARIDPGEGSRRPQVVALFGAG